MIVQTYPQLFPVPHVCVTEGAPWLGYFSPADFIRYASGRAHIAQVRLTQPDPNP